MAENPLARGAPEAQGVSSKAVLRFVQAVEANIREMHSFMLLRHGVVVAEGWWSPYAPEYPHMLFSLSKSFTSTAIGLAVAEDRLLIDDPVISFFPEDLPAEVSPNLAAMRVRHLLSMSTGQATEPDVRNQTDGNWAKVFLSTPVVYQPGTHFLYNSAATYMLSAIIQKLTGMKLVEYLQPRLFEPLGIEGAAWESCPRGINVGGWGLSIKTEDIARFGQLYLQKGVWNGKRVVPDEWIRLATSKHIDNNNGSNGNIDWNQGYGFQFWRCQHNMYRGDGAFGQYCIIMPEQDAVLAITSGLEGNMQEPLDLVWEHLLPAMQAAPLPADPNSEAALKAKAQCLNFKPPVGQAASALESKISGKLFRFDPNALGVETARFDFDSDRVVITAKAGSQEMSVTCGLGAWMDGQTALYAQGLRRVAASATWNAPDTLQLTLRFYETPFYQTVTCRFDGDLVTIDACMNANMGPIESPTLTGKMAK